MRSRHQVDTSTRFDASKEQPPSKPIERAALSPIPVQDPPAEVIEREPYIAGKDLQDAVNLAIALGRPLLVQGDPGVGKTRLAYAVAYALGLPLERATVKSTSRAQDLLYSYDAVRRLYDAQLPTAEQGELKDADAYVTLRPLGRAICRAMYGRRSVVLIDEIDKADIDFPNDLLHELEQLEFDIPEALGRAYAVPDKPELRPLVIVTDNGEKTLPAAFLRRCIFHYIEFPIDPAALDRILELHDIENANLREQAVDVLEQLRDMGLAKKPGLAELLDWAAYLQSAHVYPGGFSQIPYLGALVKRRDDQIRVADSLDADD